MALNFANYFPTVSTRYSSQNSFERGGWLGDSSAYRVSNGTADHRPFDVRSAKLDGSGELKQPKPGVSLPQLTMADEHFRDQVMFRRGVVEQGLLKPESLVETQAYVRCQLLATPPGHERFLQVLGIYTNGLAMKGRWLGVCLHSAGLKGERAQELTPAIRSLLRDIARTGKTTAGAAELIGKITNTRDANLALQTLRFLLRQTGANVPAPALDAQTLASLQALADAN